jgi:hypothetical protein
MGLPSEAFHHGLQGHVALAELFRRQAQNTPQSGNLRRGGRAGAGASTPALVASMKAPGKRTQLTALGAFSVPEC